MKLFEGKVNLMSGMGTRHDKTSYTVAQNTVGSLNYVEWESLYRENWLAGKIIDIPSSDMTRKWRVIESGLDGDNLKKFITLEKSLNLQKKMLNALQWSGLYGGAIIYMHIEGTGEPHEPLNLNLVRKGALKYIAVIEGKEAHPTEILTINPLDENYRKPEAYMVGGTTFHHTRIIPVFGNELPPSLSQYANYWGDSLLVRTRDSIIAATSVFKNIEALVHESRITLLGINELDLKLNSCDENNNPNGEKKLLSRVNALKLGMSNHGIIYYDKNEEEIQTRELNFSGLKELIYDFITICAGASDIVLSRLLGVLPGGLSVTGDGELKTYYDSINARQEEKLRPIISRIDQIMLIHLFGPNNIELGYVFPSLFQISEKERAEINRIKIDTAVAADAILPEDIILSGLQKDEIYPGIDDDLINSFKHESGGLDGSEKEKED